MVGRLSLVFERGPKYLITRVRNGLTFVYTIAHFLPEIIGGHIRFVSERVNGIRRSVFDLIPIIITILIFAPITNQ